MEKRFGIFLLGPINVDLIPCSKTRGYGPKRKLATCIDTLAAATLLSREINSTHTRTPRTVLLERAM